MSGSRNGPGERAYRYETTYLLRETTQNLEQPFVAISPQLTRLKILQHPSAFGSLH